MSKIFICDDVQAESKLLTALVRQWAQAQDTAVYISTFESSESLLFAYEDDKSVEILLLDIQMKNMNGVELARRIHEDNKAVQIIFITGFPDFISEGYDVSALHYLIKPVKKGKLFEVLDRAAERLGKSEQAVKK